MPRQNPIRPTDDQARALARSLIDTASHAALAVLTPEAATPFVTRIALGTTPDGAPITLVSTLSAHTPALTANAACALLIGAPGPKGDPLTHPRLTLEASATFVARATPAHAALRDHWLASHPKSKLYIDFADFAFVRFTVTAAHLNGGFGKAFRLTPDDIAP